MSRRFSRRGDVLRVTLTEAERDLLRQLPDELRVRYAANTADDPVRARLFPRAYLDPTEEAAEREWEALTHPELLRQRLAALEAVTVSLERAAPARRGRLVVDLGEEEVGALLGVLNDARLALGTVLGVTDDLDLAAIDPADPAGPAFAAYGWLTYLQGELVEALLGDLPA